jgi:hypothetical protein
MLLDGTATFSFVDMDIPAPIVKRMFLVRVAF